MVRYNIYCKDENSLNNVYKILNTIPYGFESIKYITSDFMPRCISFSTDVYNDEAVLKMIQDQQVPKENFVIYRNLHKHQVLL